MTKTPNDALDFIDSISALTHPPEDALCAYVQGTLSETKTEIMQRHLSKCSHCMELATLFGLPAPDTQH